MALHCYRDESEKFKQVQLTGMRRDSSWDTAASSYEQIFTWAKVDMPVTG
jgi:glycogen synthase